MAGGGCGARVRLPLVGWAGCGCCVLLVEERRVQAQRLPQTRPAHKPRIKPLEYIGMQRCKSLQ